MKTKNIIKSTLLLILLTIIGIQNISAYTGTYVHEADFKVGGVLYRGYVVEIYIEDAIFRGGHVARIISLKDVTTTNCVIKDKVYNGDIEYKVEGIAPRFPNYQKVIPNS